MDDIYLRLSAASRQASDLARLKNALIQNSTITVCIKDEFIDTTDDTDNKIREILLNQVSKQLKDTKHSIHEIMKEIV